MTAAAAAAGPVAYLGPEGTFTHQAVLDWARRTGGTGGAGGAGGPGGPGAPDAPAGAASAAVDALPLDSVAQVHDAVASGRAASGVVAIESSVEGYVTPSVDALLGSADVVACAEVVLDVSFDAFVAPGHGELTEAAAHPHGLAQCARFVAARGLTPVPAASNAAACRDITPHQVALGPRLCGELYGLRTLATAVEDVPGARTRFLVLARRDGVRWEPDDAAEWRTMLAITPVVTGPGVLARVTAAFAQRRVNMSSLVTRPLRARAGQYVFVVTLDAAPSADRKSVV